MNKGSDAELIALESFVKLREECKDLKVEGLSDEKIEKIIGKAKKIANFIGSDNIDDIDDILATLEDIQAEISQEVEGGVENYKAGLQMDFIVNLEDEFLASISTVIDEKYELGFTVENNENLGLLKDKIESMKSEKVKKDEREVDTKGPQSLPELLEILKGLKNGKDDEVHGRSKAEFTKMLKDNEIQINDETFDKIGKIFSESIQKGEFLPQDPQSLPELLEILKGLKNGKDDIEENLSDRLDTNVEVGEEEGLSIIDRLKELDESEKYSPNKDVEVRGNKRLKWHEEGMEENAKPEEKEKSQSSENSEEMKKLK